MNTFLITVAAYGIGWVIPELVFLHSPNAAVFKRVPLGMNLVLSISFAMLAYGVRA